mgnify:CR=1 FL=1|jgi:hypothetical protein
MHMKRTAKPMPRDRQRKPLPPKANEQTATPLPRPVPHPDLVAPTITSLYEVFGTEKETKALHEQQRPRKAVPRGVLTERRTESVISD